jgi:hypothetical protein
MEVEVHQSWRRHNEWTWSDSGFGHHARTKIDRCLRLSLAFYWKTAPWYREDVEVEALCDSIDLNE